MLATSQALQFHLDIPPTSPSPPRVALFSHPHASRLLRKRHRDADQDACELEPSKPKKKKIKHAEDGTVGLEKNVMDDDFNDKDLDLDCSSELNDDDDETMFEAASTKKTPPPSRVPSGLQTPPPSAQRVRFRTPSPERRPRNVDSSNDDITSVLRKYREQQSRETREKLSSAEKLKRLEEKYGPSTMGCGSAETVEYSTRKNLLGSPDFLEEEGVNYVAKPLGRATEGMKKRMEEREKMMEMGKERRKLLFQQPLELTEKLPRGQTDGPLEAAIARREHPRVRRIKIDEGVGRARPPPPPPPTLKKPPTGLQFSTGLEKPTTTTPSKATPSRILFPSPIANTKPANLRDDVFSPMKPPEPQNKKESAENPLSNKARGLCESGQLKRRVQQKTAVPKKGLSKCPSPRLPKSKASRAKHLSPRAGPVDVKGKGKAVDSAPSTVDVKEKAVALPDPTTGEASASPAAAESSSKAEEAETPQSASEGTAQRDLEAALAHASAALNAVPEYAKLKSQQRPEQASQYPAIYPLTAEEALVRATAVLQTVPDSAKPEAQQQKLQNAAPRTKDPTLPDEAFARAAAMFGPEQNRFKPAAKLSGFDPMSPDEAYVEAEKRFGIPHPLHVPPMPSSASGLVLDPPTREEALKGCAALFGPPGDLKQAFVAASSSASLPPTQETAPTPPQLGSSEVQPGADPKATLINLLTRTNLEKDAHILFLETQVLASHTREHTTASHLQKVQHRLKSLEALIHTLQTKRHPEIRAAQQKVVAAEHYFHALSKMLLTVRAENLELRKPVEWEIVRDRREWEKINARGEAYGVFAELPRWEEVERGAVLRARRRRFESARWGKRSGLRREAGRF